MIISENRKPLITTFQELMNATDNLLNENAKVRGDYYCKRTGTLLELDVLAAVKEMAIGTPFEDSIQLVSGSAFPDIVASGYYGIEVKSTEKNHWVSTGSSILESTRGKGIERIYLTFGKLCKPVQFLSRPYEECMADIAVTHYPRYKIDMRLHKGETIFDKIGIPYDILRQMDNPVAPVSKYYKSKLKEGESLWWATSDEKVETAYPPTVKLWTILSPNEKIYYAIQGYILFPEIFSGASNKKYNRYALWLATQCGIINTNIRDSFSAGGQVNMETSNGIIIKMPASFGRLKTYKLQIQEIMNNIDEKYLMEYWDVEYISKNRLRQWCEKIVEVIPKTINQNFVWDILSVLFPSILD